MTRQKDRQVWIYHVAIVLLCLVWLSISWHIMSATSGGDPQLSLTRPGDGIITARPSDYEADDKGEERNVMGKVTTIYPVSLQAVHAELPAAGRGMGKRMPKSRQGDRILRGRIAAAKANQTRGPAYDSGQQGSDGPRLPAESETRQTAQPVLQPPPPMRPQQRPAPLDPGSRDRRQRRAATIQAGKPRKVTRGLTTSPELAIPLGKVDRLVDLVKAALESFGRTRRRVPERRRSGTAGELSQAGETSERLKTGTELTVWVRERAAEDDERFAHPDVPPAASFVTMGTELSEPKDRARSSSETDNRMSATDELPTALSDGRNPASLREKGRPDRTARADEGTRETAATTRQTANTLHRQQTAYHHGLHLRLGLCSTETAEDEVSAYTDTIPDGDLYRMAAEERGVVLPRERRSVDMKEESFLAPTLPLGVRKTIINWLLTGSVWNHEQPLGSKVELDCFNATLIAIRNEVPSVRIQWQLNGQPVTLNANRMLLRKDDLLIIQDLRYEDTGLYECLARYGGEGSAEQVVPAAFFALAVTGDLPSLAVRLGDPLPLSCQADSLAMALMRGERTVREDAALGCQSPCEIHNFTDNVTYRWFHNSSESALLPGGALDPLTGPQGPGLGPTRWTMSGVWKCQVRHAGRAWNTSWYRVLITRRPSKLERDWDVLLQTPWLTSLVSFLLLVTCIGMSVALARWAQTKNENLEERWQIMKTRVMRKTTTASMGLGRSPSMQSLGRAEEHSQIMEDPGSQEDGSQTKETTNMTANTLMILARSRSHGLHTGSRPGSGSSSCPNSQAGSRPGSAYASLANSRKSSRNVNLAGAGRVSSQYSSDEV